MADNPTFYNTTRGMTLAQRFDFYAVKSDGCWIWRGSVAGRSGYGKLGFNGRTLAAHRLSWELHRGPIQPGMVVCHHCDNPRCVKPDHLFIGTTLDNVRDKIAKGRDPRGERNTEARLTESQVRNILADKRSSREIGAAYGVSNTAIWLIKSGRKWKHISRGVNG